MKTETHEINLIKAKEFLAANLPYERGIDGTNRPTSLKVINKYAVEMLKGNWRLTHQGIGFNVNGHLSDGQHRLLALVQAAEQGATEGETVLPPQPKIKIKFQVTWGLENDSFKYLDTGFARSSNQILAMAGYANQRNLAAAAKLLYVFDEHDYRYWERVKVSNEQILKTVQISGIDQYIPYCSPLKETGFIVPATTVGYFVCERGFPDGPHEDYLSALKFGENLTKDSPALVLRNYMIRSKGQTGLRRDGALHLALYIKCWNDFATNTRRSSVSWRNTEPFPMPISPKE